ncbi:hypothetical protein [uncultured Tateyamaria sp.]|uniref:hypothetical protein n=1 Tax=uncultured Tateyamaria sp. TaxID=455651 RepID=UPI00262BF58C|nr:hypothetical protein [uncultured Tateyamaria sp.]
MRELALAFLIAVASYGPVQAMGNVTMPPSTYPAPDAFCGFMQPCSGKAAQKR